MLDRAMADPRGFSKDGALQRALLDSLFTVGEPAVLLLQRPLRTMDPEVWTAMAFVVSELGGLSHAIVEDVEAMLDHPEPGVRAHVIDALTTGAFGPKARCFTRVLECLTDPDRHVREAALSAAAAVTSDVLAACAQTETHVGEMLRATVLADEGLVTDRRLPTDAERLRYVAVAALRTGDPGLLQMVLESGEADIVGAVRSRSLGRP